MTISDSKVTLLQWFHGWIPLFGSPFEGQLELSLLFFGISAENQLKSGLAAISTLFRRAAAEVHTQRCTFTIHVAQNKGNQKSEKPRRAASATRTCASTLCGMPIVRPSLLTPPRPGNMTRYQNSLKYLAPPHPPHPCPCGLDAVLVLGLLHLAEQLHEDVEEAGLRGAGEVG